MGFTSPGQEVRYQGPDAQIIAGTIVLPPGVASLTLPPGTAAAPFTLYNQSILYPSAFQWDVVTGFQPAAADTTFMWLGTTSATAIIKRVLGFIVTGGTGATSSETGMFSSPTPPKFNQVQVLTKLVSAVTTVQTGSNALTQNSSLFATSIPAGTNLWLAMRVSLATTQPIVASIAGDYSVGMFLYQNTGALSGITTITSSLVTGNAKGYLLAATLD